MKISNWRRTLAAALLAGGLFVPAPANAAPLEVNLIANADFESVDLAARGEHNGPRILGWTGRNAFAYSHDGSSSNAGVVPDYAQGANPPNSGHWYFTSTNTGGADLTMPGEFYQDIDVSTGATGEAIMSGHAVYHLSGYLSSPAGDDGRSRVNLEFLTASGGLADIDSIVGQGDDGPSDVWNLHTLSQEIQPTVRRIRVSLYGVRQSGGYSAYVDDITLTISRVPVPEPTSAVLMMASGGALLAPRRRV